MQQCISSIVAFANHHKMELDSRPAEKKALVGESIYGDLDDI